MMKAGVAGRPRITNDSYIIPIGSVVVNAVGGKLASSRVN
jgi:hypothetical protein